MVENKKREFWLFLWGIFIAFLIQVIYDAIGFFGQNLKIVIGLALAFVALAILALIAYCKFYKKKSSEILNVEQPQNRGKYGKIAYMILLGIIFSIFLNELALPEILITARIPTSFIVQYMVYFISTLIIVFSILLLIGIIVLKANPSWCLLSVSLVSICYAVVSLIGIISLYYTNNGTIPPIYTVKLFRSIFFASLFGIIGQIIHLIKVNLTSSTTT